MPLPRRAYALPPNNITNVNTEGYDRRVVEQQSRLLGGVGVGVEVAEIKRVVDDFLNAQLLSAQSDASRYEVMVQAFERLEAVLGAPEDNSSFSGRLDTLFVTIGALAMEPDSSVRRTAAVTDIQTWGDEVSRLADKIQELRKDADRQIVSSITDVNTQIKRIFELNSQIVVEQNLSRDSATLEEQREDALSKLSEYMDISTFSMSNGFLGVTGARGMVLVDSGYRALDYTAIGAISTATQFSQILVKKVDRDTGLAIGTGATFDPNRTSGRLDGLLTMRDVTLPNFAKTLGELAAGVVDQLNGAHNNNIAVPPLTTMTGRNTGLVWRLCHRDEWRQRVRRGGNAGVFRWPNDVCRGHCRRRGNDPGCHRSVPSWRPWVFAFFRSERSGRGRRRATFRHRTYHGVHPFTDRRKINDHSVQGAGKPGRRVIRFDHHQR